MCVAVGFVPDLSCVCVCVCVCKIGHLSGKAANGIMVLSRTYRLPPPLASLYYNVIKFVKLGHTGGFETPRPSPDSHTNSVLHASVLSLWPSASPKGGRRPIPVPHLGVPSNQWTGSSQGDSPASSPRSPFPCNMASSFPPK